MKISNPVADVYYIIYEKYGIFRRKKAMVAC